MKSAPEATAAPTVRPAAAPATSGSASRAEHGPDVGHRGVVGAGQHPRVAEQHTLVGDDELDELPERDEQDERSDRRQQRTRPASHELLLTLDRAPG